MKKLLLFSILTIVFATEGYSQNRLWSKTTVEKTADLTLLDKASTPLKSELFTLNLQNLKTQLQTAPSRDAQVTSTVIIPFPAPDGTLKNYRIYEASVMHPELASRYNEIASYVGQGVEDPTASIRISTTIFGLHAMAFTTSGVSYVDPYTSDLGTYIVYDKSQLRTSRTWECLTADSEESDLDHRSTENLLASDGLFRTYRLAMASTVEYSAYHITAAGLTAGTLAQKKAAVLAAMVVSMTRINGIYERDMSLTMQLVANNDAVIFVESDSFSNDIPGDLINESQAVIDNIIGSANYDIGHTVSTGGGGLAQKPSVCVAGKARGITGSTSPVGDAYDIDFVAHEIGHQFGADHTFSGIGGNCTTGTRSNTYAVEPGSGTTIMAYAGICSGVNVQSNSDAYFHAVSIAQMVSHITGSGNCVAGVANGNAAPVANAGADYTIPFGTPFRLTGSATDANGDALTYAWEQTDNQVTGGIWTVAQPPLPTNNGGPTFRSVSPTTSPVRYFPSLQNILNGNLTSGYEVVPGVARALNFALTVRDNRMPNGGQTSRDNMIVNVANTGAFEITSPSVANTTWSVGSSQTIAWNVAGTTANGINTSLVNILLSTDGGVTFGTVLAAGTPNDGSESITLPAGIAVPYARIMVEAVGNIYFAVSKSIAIGYNVTVTTTCTPYTATPNATVSGQTSVGYYGYSLNIPDSVIISDMNISVNITHARINDLRIGVAIPGSTTVDMVLYERSCGSFGVPANLVTTFDDEGAPFTCTGAAAGNNYIAPAGSLSYFDGMNSQGLWRLAVADATAATNGVLNSFTFNVCSTSTSVALATADFGFADFVVYPNPNNGNFNVRFDGAASAGVKILVHDMRGRKIYENAFSNNGLFNENIQLNNAQSGIYLMTVTDGERKEVKRIVVE